MALEVEDGTAKANAESYASVAAFDAYLTARGLISEAADEAAKEAALRLATEFISEQYDGRWAGVRMTTTQALAWPRMGVWADPEQTVYIDGTTIPTRLIRATIEAAILAASGDIYAGSGTTAGGAVIARRTKVGPIEKEEKYSADVAAAVGQDRPIVRGTKIDNLLAPLLASPSGFGLTLVRA